MIKSGRINFTLQENLKKLEELQDRLEPLDLSIGKDNKLAFILTGAIKEIDEVIEHQIAVKNKCHLKLVR